MKTTIVLAVLTACGYPQPELHIDAGPQSCEGCKLLLAIGPSIANTGETLTLEGTFAGDVTVTFPGGVTAPATITGPHRATVVVPEQATTGDLTITTFGVESEAVEFRRPSFTLGLSRFFARDNQTFGPRRTPALATARAFHASATTGRFLHVFGGVDAAGNVIGSVERMRVDADSSLGPGEQAGTLVILRARARAVRFGGHVYVVGGVAAGAPLDSIERAPVLADGTLGPFELLPERLAHARVSPIVALIGHHLYVGGGSDAMERAPIETDGIGAFEDVPGVAPSASSGASAVVGNYLYVVGDVVERAAIDPDGTLQKFELAGQLNAPRRDPMIAVVGRSLYVLGGTDLVSGAKLSTVEAATIGTDGSLAAFASSASVTLPAPLIGASVDLVGNTVRLVGGQRPMTVATVLHASIIGSNKLGAPAILPDVELATARSDHAIAIRGDKLYLVGGLVQGPSAPQITATIDVVTIGRDGSITEVAAASSQLMVPRLRCMAVVVGSFLYVLGGRAAGTGLATVERATIASDGSLGPFQDAGVTLAQGRHLADAIVIDNFLYVVAGADTPTASITTSVERASINADGTLGPFAETDDLQTQRFDPSLAVIGDRLFVLGGITQNGAVPGTASVEQATIKPDSSLAPFTTAPSLVEGRGFQTTMVIGTTLYQLLGGGVGMAPAMNLETATVGDNGNLSVFVQGAMFTNPEASTPIGILGDHVYWLGALDEAFTIVRPTVSRAQLQ